MTDISALSTSALEASASDSNAKFAAAAMRNRFAYLQYNEEDSFLDRIRNEVEYPHLNPNQDFLDLLKEAEDIDDLVQRYSHLSDLPDIYGLKRAKYDILFHVRRFKRLKGYGPFRNEVEYRPAIDDLVALAFCHHLDAKHTFQCQVEVSLPAEPYTATADIVTLLRMPKEWSFNLMASYGNNVHVFHALTVGDELLTFAVEAKAGASASDTAGHQLAFYLCSAQHQRRALGFTDHRIYGLTFIGHVAQLYVSYWYQDMVGIAPTHHSFDISSFRQHLELFVVLCKLAKNSEQEFEEMIGKHNDSSIVKKNEEAADNPWRRLFKPSKKSGKRIGRSTHRMSLEGTNERVSDGMISDSERDLNPFEEDFFRKSLETSNSFVTSENDGYNESQIPLKAELLQQYISTETTPLPPAKDIATWAQRIADEIEGRDTVP